MCWCRHIHTVDSGVSEIKCGNILLFKNLALFEISIKIGIKCLKKKMNHAYFTIMQVFRRTMCGTTTTTNN